MSLELGIEPILDELAGQGFDEAEVFAKKGRCRRLRLEEGSRAAQESREAGWAVRGSDARSSFFIARTGEPTLGQEWPQADGRPLVLPDPVDAPPWRESPEIDAPLLGEREGFELLEHVETTLAKSFPMARLVLAQLEDGVSETTLASRRGHRGSFRSRVASLRVEAMARRGHRQRSAVGAVVANNSQRLPAAALARRLADRLAIEVEGQKPERDRGEMVLAPPIGAAVLEALWPLFGSPEGIETARVLTDSRGRLASPVVGIVDDGRLPGGVLAAPFDGEGTPTCEISLVEEGIYRQPLLPWQRARDDRGRTSGCRRRPGWRDLPTLSPSHLFFQPNSGVSAASMVSGVARGYYLLDTLGPVQVDFGADQIEIPVCGFALDQGRAVASVTDAVLTGGLGSLLRGISAVGRDLAFQPRRGLFGSPSLLLSGYEIRPR